MYNTLKGLIDQYIIENTSGEITGEILNNVLNQMVSVLGSGSKFKGSIQPDSEAPSGTEGENDYFYIATSVGTYTNFGNITVSAGELAFVKKEDSSWVKYSWDISSLLSGKQDTISDLDEIRSGAVAGASAYQKPSEGIAKSDLSSGVQASLNKAETAVQTETDPTVPSWAKQQNKPSYTASEVGAIPTSEKGVAAGVATLNSQGKIPVSQLPSYVDDVLEYANLAAFPATGESGKIYVALDTNKTYRWGGSSYVEISQSLALGETSSTAFAGNRGKAVELKVESLEESVDDNNLLVEQSSLTDQQRNTALANVSNQTANPITGKMGYKVLDGSKSFASQVTDTNTIYEIRDVFDLGGTQETPVIVTVPDNSTLKFNGGIIKNCTINSDDLIIEADDSYIFENVKFTGNIVEGFVKLEWFVKTYVTSMQSTNLCAASEIESALNCGVRNVIIGKNNRYYPIQRTIEYSGDASICTEFENYYHSQSRTNNVQKPSIYSDNVVTLLDYQFNPSEKTGGVKTTQSLCISGLELRTLKPYTNLDDKGTPILKVTAKKDLWGLEINCNISAKDNSVVVNDENSGYYIPSATVESMHIPNYTGVLLSTDGGYMTFVTIKGSISSVFYGLRNNIVDNWMNSIKLDAKTKCVIGANITTAPLIVTNFHQPIYALEEANKFAYFSSSIINNTGFVWDIGVTSNGVSTIKYGFHVTYNSSAKSGFFGSQKQSVMYDNKEIRFEDNVIPKYKNLLNQTLNSNSPVVISGMSYKVKTDNDETWANVYTYSNTNKYFTINNLLNVFGSKAVLYSGRVANVYNNGTQPVVYVKDGYVGTFLNFELSFTTQFNKITSVSDIFYLFVTFDTGISNFEISLDGGETYSTLSVTPIYQNGAYQIPLPTSSRDIKIRFKGKASSSVKYIALPIIYIPDLYELLELHYYEAWNVPTEFKGTALFRSKQTGSEYSRRLGLLSNNLIYDFDGYTFGLKHGTTANRPSNLTANDAGYEYFDEDLGKMICWNGTAWINLDGTPLS